MGDEPDTDQTFGKTCRYCRSEMAWRIIADHWPIASGTIELAHHDRIWELDFAALPGWRAKNAQIERFDDTVASIGICKVCGWWALVKNVEFKTADNLWIQFYGVTGELIHLDLQDISLPAEEIARYLTIRYERRFDIHPRVMEEVVGDVFKGLGYEVVVTTFSKDGGIDIILDSGSDYPVGIQVKRTKRSIEVEQIRSLLGAMMLKGMTKGIFVTTSRFQAGSNLVAQQAASRGHYIELMDAERFLVELKLSLAGRADIQGERILESLVSQKSELKFAGQWHLNSL